MGPVIRRVVLLATIALLVATATPSGASAFSGFGAMSADATYGVQMRFTVQLPSGPPDRLELLLRYADSDSTVVAPVSPGATSAEYVLDTSDTGQHITPNTLITYRWRATVGKQAMLSPEKTLLYDDDRRGLDWHSARIGATTVHWYGGAEAQARHFGSISADAAAAAGKLLDHELAGPIDIFVYDSHDDFFGALGPGAREWTGAAIFPGIRTIFMWLGGGSSSYLERTMTHEVTHVVFQDATANPYHEPPKWFNEGLAVWSEQQSASGHEGTVRSAAGNGSLLSFDGISESFPIGADAARLSYDEGATMVAMIIDTYGRNSIAAIAAAWRNGAGDAEALEAGTGVSAAQLYKAYFASFGAQVPTAIQPAPILPSNVKEPPQPAATSGEVVTASASPAQSASGSGSTSSSGDVGWIAGLVVAGLAVGVLVGIVARRRRISVEP
ncbi:MAG: peptidase MA family metallohydrolase [Candidatus Limnocylindria bacterium]